MIARNLLGGAVAFLTLAASLRTPAGDVDPDRIGPPGFDVPPARHFIPILPPADRTFSGPALSETDGFVVVPPGGKYLLEVKLDTSRLPPGPQSKWIEVRPNGMAEPVRVLMTGFVDPLLEVEPENPRIVAVKGREPGEIELTLTRDTREELKVLSAKPGSGRISVRLHEVQAGNLYKVQVTTNYGPKETQSYFGEKIQVEVQVGDRRLTREIPLIVQLKDRIDVAPRMVYFRKADFQQLKDKNIPAMRTVDLTASLDEPFAFKIEEAKLDAADSPFKVKVEPVKDGRAYRLTVTIDKLPDNANDPNVKSLKGTLTVVTDDPESPEIRIRCTAFF